MRPKRTECEGTGQSEAQRRSRGGDIAYWSFWQRIRPLELFCVSRAASGAFCAEEWHNQLCSLKAPGWRLH